MISNRIDIGPDTSDLTTLSQYGRTFRVVPIDIYVEDRTASGRLVRDRIAEKLSWELAYEYIDGDDLDDLLDLQAEDALVLRVYSDESTYVDYDVIMRPIDRQRVSVIGDGLWGGVVVRMEQI